MDNRVGPSGTDEAVRFTPAFAADAAAGASNPLTEARLAEWGLAVRAGTIGMSWVIAKTRQAIYAAGIRGIAAEQAFDAAIRQVISNASGV